MTPLLILISIFCKKLIRCCNSETEETSCKTLEEIYQISILFVFFLCFFGFFVFFGFFLFFGFFCFFLFI